MHQTRPANRPSRPLKRSPHRRFGSSRSSRSSGISPMGTPDEYIFETTPAPEPSLSARWIPWLTVAGPLVSWYISLGYSRPRDNAPRSDGSFTISTTPLSDSFSFSAATASARFGRKRFVYRLRYLCVWKHCAWHHHRSGPRPRFAPQAEAGGRRGRTRSSLSSCGSSSTGRDHRTGTSPSLARQSEGKQWRATLHLGITNCYQRLPTVTICIRLLPTVPNCTRLLPTVLKSAE